jgi:hypothetical protein
MEKLKITEEMNVHKEWYAQASKQTLETLPEFLRHLMEDYGHDYGTIVHALAAGSIATAWAMNGAPHGGITGFQAGAVMWQFIRGWNYEENKTGMKLINYDKMLYPQYDHMFAKTIKQSTWENIQKEAKKFLEREDYVHPNVRQHWKSIVAGVVPFGYTIESEAENN